MACVVAVWIVCNELISILENLIDVGISIPAFLIPLVKNIKCTRKIRLIYPRIIKMMRRRVNDYEI